MTESRAFGSYGNPSEGVLLYPAAVSGASTTGILITLKYLGNTPSLSWTAAPGGVYEVAFKNNLSDATWTVAAQLTADYEVLLVEAKDIARALDL